ncbi:hypothetical protein L226DRAFT_332037 [Lentinus tigrinus ALCF2SS1-7]|uniref:Uncharacterized protein n=1 Tax=Lentinus tigrinus ALCF2SS1-6 TaxID=1328759 RepID=A0A5C2SGP0_9APHY|nr:hypothetical protein L227DRAFT_36136 [Lentinus tigrinus ALCF2SS1-6]RPD77786.1 hypothetical protein L226DRAFT_332037 [Lentinus tigrinus ALCF2SS1-7]
MPLRLVYVTNHPRSNLPLSTNPVLLRIHAFRLHSSAAVLVAFLAFCVVCVRALSRSVRYIPPPLLPGLRRNELMNYYISFLGCTYNLVTPVFLLLALSLLRAACCSSSPLYPPPTFSFRRSK